MTSIMTKKLNRSTVSSAPETPVMSTSDSGT